MPARVNSIKLRSVAPGSHKQIQWLRFGNASALPLPDRVGVSGLED